MFWKIRQKIGDFIKNPRSFYSAQSKNPNLLGDRDVEWAWMAAKIPSTAGRILDFGNGGYNIGLVAALKGHTVQAIDLEEIHWTYQHPRLDFKQCNLFELDPRDSYDTILCCSVIEHIGIPGRYGNSDDPDGDLKVMNRFLELLRKDGRIIMTIPVGLDAVFPPMTRIYGQDRLARLLSNCAIMEEMYWTKDKTRYWAETSKQKALSIPCHAGTNSIYENYYGLGCYVLGKKQ